MTRGLPLVLVLVLLAACAGGAGPVAEPTTAGSEASRQTTIEGQIADVSASARLILLASPVDGISVIALEEGARIFGASGEEVALVDLSRGQTIAAGGQKGSSDGLLARAVFVIAEAERPVESEPVEALPVDPTAPVAARTAEGIVLDVPREAQTISSPVEVRGSVTAAPASGALRVRVYDALGEQIGESAVSVLGAPGQPGTFRGHVPFEAPASGGGTVVVADVSPSSRVGASVQVQIGFDGTPSIGVTAVVASLTLDPPVIALAEPARGFSAISVRQDARISYLNGGSASLADVRAGTWLWASGFRESTDVLAATRIVLIEEGDAAAVEEPPTIAIDAPQEGEVVANPIGVSGSISAAAFDANLVARVYDASNALVADAPLAIDVGVGQPARFSGEVAYATQLEGEGRLEVAAVNAGDGSILASAAVAIVLVPLPEFMLVGRVASVSADARTIELAEPIEGFERVAIVDETLVLGLDGSEASPDDLVPGMKIEVSGRPGAAGTLTATSVRVLP